MNRMVDRPYGVTMGFGEERDAAGRVILFLDYSDDFIGRPGYLHGGAIAGLLEAAGFAALLVAIGEADASGEVPAPLLKPINVTVTYMRGGVEKRTYARATIERLGRRVANIEVAAWQDDPAKPIAMAQMNILIDRSSASDEVTP
jgi:acyl-coenzyme A thioesterase PaaI-like protein